MNGNAWETRQTALLQLDALSPFRRFRPRRKPMSKIATVLTTAIVGVVVVLVVPAGAQPRDRQAQAGLEEVSPQVDYPADSQNGPLGAIQGAPFNAVQKGEITCCPSPGCGCPQQRRIEYRNHCRLRKGAFACAPPMQTVLAVPAGGCGQCAVEVPVCIPACCTDAPQVNARRGLLGRTRVLYRWCCGFEVEVVFCGNGDLIVHYDGV